jgi:hypothetical protein
MVPHTHTSNGLVYGASLFQAADTLRWQVYEAEYAQTDSTQR